MLEWGEEEGGARVASDQKGGTIARSQRAFCKSLDLIVCWTHPLQRFVIESSHFFANMHFFAVYLLGWRFHLFWIY